MNGEHSVEVEEIWMPTVNGDGAAVTKDGKHYKLVAYIVNGYPVVLEKDFILERRKVSKEEADNIIEQSKC